MGRCKSTSSARARRELTSALRRWRPLPEAVAPCMADALRLIERHRGIEPDIPSLFAFIPQRGWLVDHARIPAARRSWRDEWVGRMPLPAAHAVARACHTDTRDERIALKRIVERVIPVPDT